MFKTLHAVSIVYFIVSGALSGLAKSHLVSTSTVPVKLHCLHLHIFLKKSLKVAVTFKIKYTKLTKSKCSLSTIGVIKSSMMYIHLCFNPSFSLASHAPVRNKLRAKCGPVLYNTWSDLSCKHNSSRINRFIQQ